MGWAKLIVHGSSLWSVWWSIIIMKFVEGIMGSSCTLDMMSTIWCWYGPLPCIPIFIESTDIGIPLLSQWCILLYVISGGMGIRSLHSYDNLRSDSLCFWCLRKFWLKDLGLGYCDNQTYHPIERACRSCGWIA